MAGERARSALTATPFGVRWVEVTGSTNSDLLDAARHGTPAGAVLVADRQEAGRGRLGRSWEAPPGSSLLVSVLLRPEREAELVHLWSMAVGVSAAEACRDVTSVDVRLKWPNDLVVDVAAVDGAAVDGRGQGWRKLGGILAESVVIGDRVDAVVVGLGLNVNWPRPLPDELAATAIALDHLVGREVDREELLIALLLALDGWCRRLDEDPDGPARLLARHRERSATLGTRVRIEQVGESFEGLAVDVTAAGHLLVDLDDGDRREVVVGDVVHLRPAG